MDSILLGFENNPELQPLLLLVFLVIYIAAVAGNLLIIVLVVTDRHLHTPMYYFVASLSAVEICYVSIILSRLIGSLATGDRTIPLESCFVQYFFFGIVSSAETLLLTAMCCDRYLAICHPLRYPALMSGRVCGHMVAGSWIFSIFYNLVQTLILQFTNCGTKEYDHFLCDFGSSGWFCGETQTLILLIFLLSLILAIGHFLFILVTYICIIIVILKTPSSTGKQKAFSACSSHLIVVTAYYVSGLTIYVLSQIQVRTILYKIFFVTVTVLIPLINPVIYCLRNKDVYHALRKAVMRLVDWRHRQGV